VLFIYSIICTLTIIFFNGTGDGGDSIHHYLFARYAPIHPELYFDHWAKPLYVLLASPFAHFGFTGIKIFNAIISISTVFFTYKIVERLKLDNAIVAAIILICTPLFFVLTFSGLTEPLFALFISLSLFALLKNKNILACILISFLPFIRSEGLIIIAAYILYFIIKKEWKFIPLFFAGSMLYSIAGFFVYHDFLWTFTNIPYAKLSSSYGSGKLFHFVEQLIYVTGIPIYVLFWFGIISMTLKSIRKKLNLELRILVLLSFLIFLIAHSTFWYLGIFNSMGLKRVMISVVPLISIIALMGFNFISEELLSGKKIPKIIFKGLLIIYILIFPFTSNPAAIKPEKDLMLSKSQLHALEVTEFIKKNNRNDRRFVYSNPYLSEALNIDHFDENRHVYLTKEYLLQGKTNDIIIWENWFAPVEHGITQEILDSKKQLIKIFSKESNDNNTESFAVYRYK
jgi:hypothetical protein